MNKEIFNIFCKNLKRLRNRYGCSCKQLSELIGCDASYISKVENQRIIPSLDKVISIADFFGIRFNDLFTE